LIVVVIAEHPEFCEFCAGSVKSEGDPDFNQDFEENSEEGKSYFLDHIEPMFSNNIYDQLKSDLLSHVLYIAFSFKLLVVVNPINTAMPYMSSSRIHITLGIPVVKYINDGRCLDI
jgi:hypothetical protein